MFRKCLEFILARPLAGLAIIFLCTVLIRLPNLNRPLSKHHEANAALVLINAEVWNEKGPSTFNFLPVNSYHFPGDDFNDTNNLAKGYVINNSFGALWYIAPYYFFKLSGVQPSPLWLQVFNLLLHLLVLWLIFKIAILLFVPYDNKNAYALAVVLFYAFAPGPLWFHGNGYSHEIAVLPFVFAAVLVYLQMVTSNHFNLEKITLLFFLIIGGILCDWLMCFVAFALFIIEFSQYKKRNKPLALPFTLTSAVVTGVGLVVLHFSSLMGFDNYMQALLQRYELRGVSGSLNRDGLAANAGIISYYGLGYGISIITAVAALLFKRSRKILLENSRLTYFLITTFLVAFSHHLIFIGFTVVHDYSVVKGAIFIAILSAVFIVGINKKLIKLTLFLTVLPTSIFLYYLVNRPGKTAANGQPYNYFKDLGNKIKSVAKPDEYVFSDVPEFSYNLVFYSKRYYKKVSDEQEAIKIFQSLPGKQAIFIKTNRFDYTGHSRMRKP